MRTENSSGDHTIEVLKNAIVPGIGVIHGTRGVVLVDDFKSHSKENVKAYTKSLKSGTNASPNSARYLLWEWCIMAGGITSIHQKMDKFLGEFFKGNYREYYDDYMLSAPTNEKGDTIAPSYQLCAIWVVKAWDRIPEKLV